MTQTALEKERLPWVTDWLLELQAAHFVYTGDLTYYSSSKHHSNCGFPLCSFLQIWLFSPSPFHSHTSALSREELISKIFTFTLQFCHTFLPQLIETLMLSLPLFPIHASTIPLPIPPTTVVLTPVKTVRDKKIEMRLKRL